MTPSRRTIDGMTLAGAAADQRLLVVRCSFCRKSDTYLTVDLVKVFGASRHPYRVFDSCRYCGRGEWLKASLRFPTNDDVGHLRVRRPAGQQIIQLWEEDWFG